MWESQSESIVTFNPGIQTQAENIMKLGIKMKDALHIACAISANTDAFITTDQKLLNKQVNGINITNPMDFVRRYFDEN